MKGDKIMGLIAKYDAKQRGGAMSRNVKTALHKTLDMLLAGCADDVSPSLAADAIREHETLRSQLGEAVALLRRVYFDWDGEKHVRANDDLVSTYAIDECVAGDAHAFLARTPGPVERPHRDLDTYDQRADEPISQFVQGRPFTLQNTQEARQAYEDCRDVAIALRAENARLREALAAAASRCDSAIKNTDTHAFYRIRDIARAALAGGEK